MDAYPQFMNWAKSGGKDVLDWYTLEVSMIFFTKEILLKISDHSI